MKMKTLSFLILALSVCFITAEIEQDQFSNEVITSDHDAMIKSSDGISSVQKELTKKKNEPAAKQKFDSYGNPIVNETPALPDWAEQDVSALKEEIQKTLEQRDNFQKNKRDVNVIREIEYNLGNFIGQALIREIDISTIIDLHDRKTINKTVSQSVFDFLHYYENEKYALAEMMKKEYEQTNYNSQILDFISFYQGNENELLKIESTRATPSGEYTHYYGTVGMTNLTGATTIWDGSAGTYIDVSEDVPIGFNFYFYQGDDPDVNTEVRVSTHGYSTMYQQGGGALDGTDWSNDAITSPTDPDGYIATWWDDIIVTDQGSTDKVSYKVEGSVGSRIFTVEYFSVTRNGGDTDDFHYFQTVFYEYFNRIWIKYGNWDADASDNATCGIEDYSGLDGDGGPNTLNSNDVRPTYNYAFYPGIQGLWTGNISTDWDDADNWDDGFVPNQYDDVVIPAGCPNYPELTGQLGIDTADHDYDCNSLTIDSGASLLVTGHSVNSYGELTVAGTLDIGDDLYLYSGSTVDLSGTIQIGTTAGWYGQALHYSGSTFNQTAGHYYVESIYLQNGSQFNGTGGRTHIYVDDFSGDNSVEIDDPDSYFYSFQVDTGASALLFSCDYDLEVTYDTDLNGPLDINSFTMNSQYFDVFNEGELIIDSGGTVNVTGNGPYFHDGGSLTMNSGSELNSELHILFQTGSIENVSGGDIFLGSSFSDADDIFSPTGGSVTFDGSSTSYIYGTTAFYDLNIDKTGANTVFLNSDCVVTNDLTITEGELTLNGYELTVDDNCSVYGTLNMTNAADVLNAGSTSYDQFYFYDGSTGNISAGNIYLAWGMVVYSGSSFTATTSNTIHYNSATFRSGISNGDPNTVFGNIEVDKSSGYFQIWADGIEPIVVDGDFTLAADNEMETLDLSMVVNGTFSETSSSAIYLYNYPFRASGDSDNGSNSTENAEGNYREGSRDRGGYLEIDTDFTLNGLMDVGDGDALIHGEFELASTGTLTIDGGTFVGDVPFSRGWQYLYGELNLSDGLFELTNNGPRFDSGATTNVSGGIIRCVGFYSSYTAGVFVPTGGVVEFNGIIADGNIICYPGNSFYDLRINCTTGNTVHYRNDTTVQNDVEILAGALENDYSPTDNYNLYVGGDWTNNVGAGGFVPNEGTVTFFGGDFSDITTDETFYNLAVDKTLVHAEAVEIGSYLTVNVNNDLDIDDGTLDMSNGSTLNIGNDLNIALNAGLNAVVDTGLNISIEGDWTNNNVTYDSYIGFSPGTSTVTFNGSSDQYLTTACTQEDFYDLVIDNSGGNFKSSDNIQVLDDLMISNGGWVDNTNYLTHYVHGDFTVAAGAGWFGTTNNTLVFKGTADQNVTFDPSTTDGYFYNVLIDKTVSRTILSDPAEGKIAETVSKDNENSRSMQVTLLTDVIALGAGSLIVDEGTFDLNGHYYRCTGNVTINDGAILSIDDNAWLEVGGGDALNVNNGGTLELLGSAGNEAKLTHHSGYYDVEIESGGTLSAEYAVFEYMSANGVQVKDGAIIDAAHPLHNCIFREGTNGGTLLTIDNNQTFTANNVNFPNNTWSGASNVSKTLNQGYVEFFEATGDFAGEAYDNDPNNLIDWTTGGLPDLEITNVIWSDMNPYACDEINVEITVYNNGTADIPPGSGFYLDLYYDLGAPPLPYDVGDQYGWIDFGIPAGDFVMVQFDIINDIAESWDSYVQVDTEEDISELDEGNNIWGPDAITWNLLPTIDDLTIQENAGNIELNWTYPITVDYYNIYISSDPYDFSGVIPETSLTESYDEPSDTKMFYYVTAVRECVPTLILREVDSKVRRK